MSLVVELLETIERHPPAIEARKLLIQTYIEFGWFEAAGDAAGEVLEFDPDDADAQEWFLTFHRDDSQPLSVDQSRTNHQSLATKLLPRDLASAKRQLSQGYQEVRMRAKKLQGDLRVLHDLLEQQGVSFRYNKRIHDVVTEIANGRISKVVRARRPGGAREISRAMEADPDRALEIAIADLADMAHWLRTPTNQASAIDNDEVREALVKRVRTLIAALPDELQPHASSALMHVEHEVLKRSYVCNETMYGDPIADVPRERFWVSEDGYPWDMEELAQALACNGGVMRNPLSRQMFTPNDVRAIVQHPLGTRLAALQVEQSMLMQGLRPKTIDQLGALAQVLLDDMSLDSIPSRQAVDGFLAYVATLPQAEQRAIDTLRVPAKDSHTGQPFDTSIGEAVRDAQGNRVCFHKTGDFIRQAAQHLRRRA